MVTGTTQMQLSRLSGVHQPSISQMLSGRVEVSEDMLGRLLGCMGRQLVVTCEAVDPALTRAERRSWLLHRRVASELTVEKLPVWLPVIEGNLERLRRGVSGQPHSENVERWTRLVAQGDLGRIKRVLTGVDRDSIEMREVSPFGGILSQEQRLQVLAR